MSDTSMQKLAKDLAARFGNDDMDDETSVGFVRFILYSCVFFAAVYECGEKGRCPHCKAEAVIMRGVEEHPELQPEVQARNDVILQKRKHEAVNG